MKMSNGAIYEVNPEFEMIKQELMAGGIQVVGDRKTEKTRVCQQYFDGADWLDDKQVTIFEYIPVIPLYGNFEISEDKVIYYGEVRSLMDPQRVLNYSESRKVEETSLARREKIAITKEQATSPDVRADLATLNVNTKPVLLWDYVPDQPPPFSIPGPQPNMALMQITESMERRINRTSGKFEEGRGYYEVVQPD